MNSREKKFTFVHGVLWAELVALIIGVMMTVTPSKTGSDYSLAAHFIDDPPFIAEVVVYFLLTNVLMLALAAVFWVWTKREARKG